MHIEIVGAGISVFYIALLLGREVRDVTIFEASDRVGGHIYTRGFPPQAGAEDIYFEAGAMSRAAANAIFLSEQFSCFYDVVRQREGNILFAGEHLSRHHTWIAGAINSALYTYNRGAIRWSDPG